MTLSAGGGNGTGSNAAARASERSASPRAREADARSTESGAACASCTTAPSKACTACARKGDQWLWPRCAAADGESDGDASAAAGACAIGVGGARDAAGESACAQLTSTSRRRRSTAALSTPPLPPAAHAAESAPPPAALPAELATPARDGDRSTTRVLLSNRVASTVFVTGDKGTCAGTGESAICSRSSPGGRGETPIAKACESTTSPCAWCADEERSVDSGPALAACNEA